jgi:hypothetical protein
MLEKYYDYYDNHGFFASFYEIQERLGKEFDKLPDKERQEQIELNYFAKLLISIHLENECAKPSTGFVYVVRINWIKLDSI